MQYDIALQQRDQYYVEKKTEIPLLAYIQKLNSTPKPSLLTFSLFFNELKHWSVKTATYHLLQTGIVALPGNKMA